MIKAYLFDWGDTLMVDLPSVSGKMCDWEIVETVPGAKEVLQTLSKSSKIYIATGAADSTESEIKQAFERVDLSQFISGYFCKANVGLSKGSLEFLQSILESLDIPAENVAMVGDNFEKDIEPAIAVGIQAFWYVPNSNTDTEESMPDNVSVIKQLNTLYT